MTESTKNHTAVPAAKPIAPYVGGKRNLAARLVEKIEAVPHKIYAEPFVGMGGVFLRRTTAPQLEVINDAQNDVATLFRILQRHYPQFVETLRFQVTSRTEFYRLVQTDPDTLTDLERAARFLYLQRTAFGGKVAGRSFGVDKTRARFNLTDVEPMLADLHERLAGVVIECLDFDAFLARYDAPGALFFCDPPYWGSEGYYGPQFKRADFERLSATLKGLKGRFILTLNDVPEVRDLFGWAAIEPVDTTYSLAKAGTKKVGELIISTPKPPHKPKRKRNHGRRK
ncbi:MAG: DNA adenine methylase [Alphaproteobacteria bacterium]